MGAGRQVVLVVDDDPGFRTLARSLLERAGFAVLEAGDADEALTAADARPPHLVLLDVRLPRISGYELFREFRDLFGEGLPIIFVSGERVEPYDRVAGLLLGADDYLVKPFDPDELIARVRCSLRDRSIRVTAASEVSADEVIAELTPREQEVLTLLASGYSSAQVAHELVISPRTVGTHVQHILSKLGVSNRTQAVALVHRAGRPDVVAHSSGGAPDSGSEFSAASDSDAELLSLSPRRVVGQV